MPRYVMLLKYTDKGIAQVKDSSRRADTFREWAAKHGAKVDVQLWTMGEYDGVVILSAPDDAAVATLALALGQLDFVRSNTLRAFDEAEFQAILGRMR
jgi:uncharacterized protein with GYD domain